MLAFCTRKYSYWCIINSHKKLLVIDLKNLTYQFNCYSNINWKCKNTKTIFKLTQKQFSNNHHYEDCDNKRKYNINNINNNICNYNKNKNNDNYDKIDSNNNIIGFSVKNCNENINNSGNNNNSGY